MSEAWNASEPGGWAIPLVLLLGCVATLIRTRSPRKKAELYFWGLLALCAAVANAWLLPISLFLLFTGAFALSTDVFWGMLFGVPPALIGLALWRVFRQLRKPRPLTPAPAPAQPPASVLPSRSIRLGGEPDDASHENTRYVLSVPLSERSWSLKGIGLYFLLGLLFWLFVGFRDWNRGGGAKAFLPLLATLGFIAVALLFGWTLITLVRSSTQKELLKALQSPNPEDLYQAATKRLKDGFREVEVARAQARALAFALYAKPEEARAALLAIPWSAKPPLIRSTEPFCQAWIALLCDREPMKARALYGVSQATAAVHPALASAAAERSHKLFKSACLIFADETPAESVAFVESMLESQGIYDRILARMTLAQLMEDAGRLERAQELRSEVLRLAPHARGLQLKRADFETPR